MDWAAVATSSGSNSSVASSLLAASLSATGINFTLVIDDAEVVPAMQRLHSTFFTDAVS